MTLRRTMRGLAAGALALSPLAVTAAAGAAPTAPAGTSAPVAPVALGDNGPLAASAEGSLLTVAIPGLSPSILPATGVDLARSIAEADSDADLDPDKPGGQRTGAMAATTGDTALLGAPLELAATVATAPEDEVLADVIVPLDAAPLLDLEAIRTSAEAHWVSDTECVALDVPMSRADQSLADLTLLEIADGQSILALDTDDSDGAVDTLAETRLVQIGSGGQRAVQARTTTTVTSLNLFNGLAGPGSAVQVDAVQSPDLTVQASGLPGGASVTGPQPIVNVAVGDSLIVLDQANQTEEATLAGVVVGDLLDVNTSVLAGLVEDLGIPGLGALLEPVEAEVIGLLDSLQPVIRVSMPYSQSIAADGTSASAQGSLLRIEVLPPDALPEGNLGLILEPLRNSLLQPLLNALGADLDEPILQVDLAPYQASVEAPAGGIDCDEPDDDNPLRDLNKHASATEVAPGGVFDYVISVPNRGPCTLTDLVVTDVVTGPGTIESTQPAGTIEGNTVTWELGELAPNDTIELTVTVRVDADAPAGSSFDDEVTATASCGDRPVEEDDRVDDVPTVVTDFDGPCNVAYSNKDASHLEVIPGQAFAYYIHAFNTGAEPCTDITITDELDDRLAFVDCSYDCTHADGTVTWNLDELAGGSSTTLTVVVRVADDATGTLTNTAVIDPENGPPTTVTTSGPEITDTPVPKDPAPAQRPAPGAPGSPGGPTGPLPRTGAGVATGAAALMAAGFVGLQALRRRLA